jgi:MarR family transcriptional regulator, organic hydroperoxide resistance regulator
MSRKAEHISSNRLELMRRLSFLGQMQSTETAHFHQTAASANGINITDSKTISVLMQEGAMTAGQLAVRLNLTTGAVTNVIDRLEHAGFVHRDTDPDDRRRVIVSYDPQKTAVLGQAYRSMGVSFQKLLEQYSDEQLEFLVQFFEAAIKLSRQETQKFGKRT